MPSNFRRTLRTSVVFWCWHPKEAIQNVFRRHTKCHSDHTADIPRIVGPLQLHGNITGSLCNRNLGWLPLNRPSGKQGAFEVNQSSCFLYRPFECPITAAWLPVNRVLLTVTGSWNF